MSSQKFLEGKTILITSWSYATFGGAALNAVELAEQLVRFGAKPYFFSYDIEGPLAEYINGKFKTKVITDSVYYLVENEDKLDNIQLNINDYDYIWVGSNIIPISIINQLNTAKILPKFIFIHMSSLIAYPLEAPLLLEFEKQIASRILTISEETTNNCVYRVLGKDIPLERWYNPVPSEFRYINDRDGKLKKIAVISSSYPTDEIINIRDKIESHGITIDYIGKFNNNIQKVDAEFYDKYDLVIGIGKDAKYSLVSGVPIYVYGRFGGSGYIDNDNYTTNNAMNFSGRGFDKKSSQQIYKEIINGYEDAVEFHKAHRNNFIKEFSIDIIAESLFRGLEKERPKKLKLSSNYIKWLVSMQIILMQRIQSIRDLKVMGSQVLGFEKDLASRDAEISRLNLEVANFMGIKRSIRLVVGNIKRRLIR